MGSVTKIIKATYGVGEKASIEDIIKATYGVGEKASIEDIICSSYLVSNTGRVEKLIQGTYNVETGYSKKMKLIPATYEVAEDTFFPSMQNSEEDNEPGTPTLNEYNTRIYPRITVVCPDIDTEILLPGADILPPLYIREQVPGGWTFSFSLWNADFKYTKGSGLYKDLITEEFYSLIRRTRKFLKIELAAVQGDVVEYETYPDLVIQSVIESNEGGIGILNVAGKDFISDALEKEKVRSSYVSSSLAKLLSSDDIPVWQAGTAYQTNDLVVWNSYTPLLCTAYFNVTLGDFINATYSQGGSSLVGASSPYSMAQKVQVRVSRYYEEHQVKTLYELITDDDNLKYAGMESVDYTDPSTWGKFAVINYYPFETLTKNERSYTIDTQTPQTWGWGIDTAIGYIPEAQVRNRNPIFRCIAGGTSGTTEPSWPRFIIPPIHADIDRNTSMLYENAVPAFVGSVNDEAMLLSWFNVADIETFEEGIVRDNTVVWQMVGFDSVVRFTAPDISKPFDPDEGGHIYHESSQIFPDVDFSYGTMTDEDGNKINVFTLINPPFSINFSQLLIMSPLTAWWIINHAFEAAINDIYEPLGITEMPPLIFECDDYLISLPVQFQDISTFELIESLLQAIVGGYKIENRGGKACLILYNAKLRSEISETEIVDWVIPPQFIRNDGISVNREKRSDFFNQLDVVRNPQPNPFSNS